METCTWVGGQWGGPLHNSSNTPPPPCRREFQDTSRTKQSCSCWTENVCQSGDPAPDATLLSPWRAKCREECLWEVEHFIMQVAVFAHLVVNLCGLREAAFSPLCCRHRPASSSRAAANARQWCGSSGQDWASKSHLPLSPEEIEALVKLLNKTTSLVAPREMSSLRWTPGRLKLEITFGRVTVVPPMVKGGKWQLFHRKVLNRARWSERCHRILLCCSKTSPYESSGS